MSAEAGDYQCVVYALKPAALGKFNAEVAKNDVTTSAISSAFASAKLTANKNIAKLTINIHVPDFSLPHTGEWIGTCSWVLPDPVNPPDDHLQWPLWMMLFVIAIVGCAVILTTMIVATISARKNKRNIRVRHLPNESNAERLLARYLSSLRQFSHNPNTSSVWSTTV